MTTRLEPHPFLQQQLHLAVGQPIRVAIYTRLAEGIRSGAFRLGEMLPRETELSAMLGVSRTPVRPYAKRCCFSKKTGCWSPGAELGDSSRTPFRAAGWSRCGHLRLS